MAYKPPVVRTRFLADGTVLPPERLVLVFPSIAFLCGGLFQVQVPPQ